MSQVRALLFPPPGSVVQLVRTPACHAGGRGFKSLPSRHPIPWAAFSPWDSPAQFQDYVRYASVAQSVEQRTENPRVVGSIPTGGTISSVLSYIYHTEELCRCSSSGRAPPCQGGGSEFEPRHLLQQMITGAIIIAPVIHMAP